MSSSTNDGKDRSAIQEIGLRIRGFREAAGLSRAQVCEAVRGIEQGSLKSIERGERPGTTLAELEGISLAVGVTIGTLLGEATATITPPEPGPTGSEAQEEKFHQHSIEECGERLLMRVVQIDPAWEDRLRAVFEERALSPWQAFGAFIGYVLDHSIHMEIPNHPEFEATVFGGATGECPVCRKEWRRAYRTQPVCSNVCARIYYGRPDEAGDAPAEGSEAPADL